MPGLDRIRPRELTLLFNENSDGVLFAALDSPLRWPDAPDERDAAAAWAVDHLRVSRANAALATHFGGTIEALVGRPASIVFPDHEQACAQIRALCDAGRLHLSAVPRRRLDGSIWLADVDTAAMRDGEGRILGHFGMVRDVTARELAAQKLSNSEARLALALEGGDLHPWSLDLATARVQVEPHWAARFGFTVEDFSSRDRIRQNTHPGDATSVHAALGEHLLGNTPSFSASYRQATAAGEFRWVEMHGKVTARAPDGSPRTVTGIARDVHDRRVLEQRVQVAERMASLGTLAAGSAMKSTTP